jgi:hypothetical protein
VEEAEAEAADDEQNGEMLMEPNDDSGEGQETVEETPVLLLKKDSEQFDNADMGLAHTVHKIG